MGFVSVSITNKLNRTSACFCTELNQFASHNPFDVLFAQCCDVDDVVAVVVVVVPHRDSRPIHANK